LRASTIAAFGMSLLVQVGFPLFMTLRFRRRTRAPWTAFFCGGIVFAVFQLFTWLPLSFYVDTVVEARIQSEEWAFLWMLAVGLATSLIEEGGRLVGFRWLGRHGHSLQWRNGVMYGLGHGGVETVLFIAGLTFVNLLAYLALSPRGISAVAESVGSGGNAAFEQALLSIANTHWTQPLTVAFERVLALGHQVAWSLLVMQSLVSRQKRWFGFAVLFHSSVAIIVPGMARLFGFVPAELVNLALAAFSVWLIYRLRDVND